MWGAFPFAVFICDKGLKVAKAVEKHDLPAGILKTGYLPSLHGNAARIALITRLGANRCSVSG